MTMLVRCDRCGAEKESQYRDCEFLTVNFSKYNYREETKHYCPSCAFDIMDKMGVNMVTWEEYEKSVIECNCPVCKEASE